MADRGQLEHKNAEDCDANIEASGDMAQDATISLQMASQESARKSDQASLTQPHGPSSDSADSSASFALSFRSLSSATFLGAASEEKIDERGGGLESATDSSIADPPFSTAAVSQAAVAPSGVYQSLEAAAPTAAAGGDSAAVGSRSPAQGLESARRSEQSQSFFPSKLYNLILDAEAEGQDHIVSWTANGSAFRIHDPQAFIRDIVPRYFKQRKLDSFKRQLLLYGFDRIPRGPEEGAYAHNFFLRGRPELTKKIKRLKQSEKMRRGNWEPDFTSP